MPESPSSHDFSLLHGLFEGLQIHHDNQEVDDTITSPLHVLHSSSSKCLSCQGIDSLSRLKPCGHSLCERCLRFLFEGDTRSLGQYMVCPACKHAIEELDPPWPNQGQIASSSHILQPPQPADSADPRPSPLRNSGAGPQRSISFSSVHSGVLRITNFPASIRATDLEIIVEPLVGEISVHILQDRDPNDGRTISPLFIEVLEGAAATEVAMQALQGSTAFGGTLCCKVSSQEEMLEYIFPSWHAGFTGSQPFFLYEGCPFEGNFIREEEIMGLLQLCKSENPHILIAPERPFLNIATIISKMPWRSPYLYSNAFATSLLTMALAALDILFTTAKDRIPDYLDVATKLAQSIYDCPAAHVADISGVAKLLEQNWPGQSPSSIRIPNEPYFSPKPSPSPSERASPDAPPSTKLPTSSNEPERSYARRRPASHDTYASVALEFGVDEELVRAIARRLR